MRVERIPIRKTTRLGRDGARTRSLSIYCLFQGKTFSAEHCRDCPKLVTWPEDYEADGASVVCASDTPPPVTRAIAIHASSRLAGRFDAVASDLPIGIVMEGSTFAVEGGLPLETLRGELGPTTGHVVPVVDENGKLIGVLATDRVLPSMVPAASGSHPELQQLLRRVAPRTVREVMTAHVLAFPETGLMRDALNAMIVERVRYLPVVSAEGTLVGMVWDVDLLSWLSHEEKARTR